jgi:hypothetical protein
VGEPGEEVRCGPIGRLAAGSGRGSGPQSRRKTGASRLQLRSPIYRLSTPLETVSVPGIRMGSKCRRCRRRRGPLVDRLPQSRTEGGSRGNLQGIRKPSIRSGDSPTPRTHCGGGLGCGPHDVFGLPRRDAEDSRQRRDLRGHRPDGTELHGAAPPPVSNHQRKDHGTLGQSGRLGCSSTNRTRSPTHRRVSRCHPLSSRSFQRRGLWKHQLVPFLHRPPINEMARKIDRFFPLNPSQR